MKTAEKNIKGSKNTNTTENNSIVEKYTHNVIIRMGDFYPESVGGHEYCMVSKDVYAELLRYKYIDEGVDIGMIDPDSTPTVIIETKDFYPRGKSKEQYIEIRRDEFDKLMAYRAVLEFEKNSPDGNSDKVTVRTRDFYPFLCSSKEYTELERNTYETLLRYMTLSDHKNSADDHFCKPTAFVKVRVNDFYPDVAEEEIYNDIPVEIFMELLKYKGKSIDAEKMKRKSTVRIKIADYYPQNCGNEDYCKELKSYVKGKGLGTPATRADIIEGLISAKYIERKKKLLYLTEFGKKYINALPENNKSAELTAHWEQMLSDIEQGKCKEEDLMNEIIKNVNDVIENDEVTVEPAAEDTEETAAEQPAEIGKCPWCGSPIREGPKAFYCSNGEDCDFFIYKHDKRIGRSYTANEISELLANGKVTLRGCTSSKGNKYAAVSSERLQSPP